MPTKTESKQLENQHPHEDNATQYTPRTPTSHVQEGQFIPSRPAPKPPSTPLSSMSVSHKTPSSQSLPRSDSQSDIRSSTLNHIKMFHQARSKFVQFRQNH